VARARGVEPPQLEALTDLIGIAVLVPLRPASERVGLLLGILREPFDVGAQQGSATPGCPVRIARGIVEVPDLAPQHIHLGRDEPPLRGSSGAEFRTPELGQDIQHPEVGLVPVGSPPGLVELHEFLDPERSGRFDREAFARESARRRELRVRFPPIRGTIIGITELSPAPRVQSDNLEVRAASRARACSAERSGIRRWSAPESSIATAMNSARSLAEVPGFP
jgi:hypothetical protein